MNSINCLSLLHYKDGYFFLAYWHFWYRRARLYKIAKSWSAQSLSLIASRTLRTYRKKERNADRSVNHGRNAGADCTRRNGSIADRRVNAAKMAYARLHARHNIGEHLRT